MYSKEFGELRVGALFLLNGNTWHKQSTRTARLLEYGRVFYFRKTEVVHPCAW